MMMMIMITIMIVMRIGTVLNEFLMMMMVINFSDF